MSVESPFALFDLEPTLQIDLVALEKSHRALSVALHPDAQSHGGADRVLAAQRLAQLNAGYKLLRDPIARAEAVLAARGVALGDGQEPAPASALLMAVLEAREALSDARRARDVAACARMLAAARHDFAEVMRRLTVALDANDLASAIRCLGELRYHARLEKDARDSVALLEDEGL